MRSVADLAKDVQQISFGSDNHCEVHPQIMQALQVGNRYHAHSYGLDPFTVEAEKYFQQHFGPDTKMYFVFNGTAANVVSLSALVRPYEAIICSEQAHIYNSECGAPEKHLGVKLLPIPTADGKLRVQDLDRYKSWVGDQHAPQPRVVSLSQPTELGTLYTVEEIRALCQRAHELKMLVHIDGARLANAAVALGRPFKEWTTDCGVDALSFGGTKNGLMFGEAVLILNPQFDQGVRYLRKQLLQLPSKSRFVGLQFCAYFENELWREIASHENQMAQRLALGLREYCQLTQKVETNAVFALIPQSVSKRLRERFFYYIWDPVTFEARLMTTFSTRPETVDEFVNAFIDISRGSQ